MRQFVKSLFLAGWVWFVCGTAFAAAVATPTVLSDYAYTSSGATHTSGSLSPSGDALIVVGTFKRWVVGAAAVSSITSGFSVTGAGWQRAIASGVYGSENVEVELWYAITTSSPGSGTVVGTWPSTFSQPKGFVVLEIASDYDPTTPIATQTGDSTGTSSLAVTTDHNGTLGTAPNSDSLIVQMMMGATANTTVTPVTGFTLLGTNVGGGNKTAGAAYAAGSNGTGYGGQFGSAQTAGAAFVAMEISPVASGGASIPVLHHQLRNQ